MAWWHVAAEMERLTAGCTSIGSSTVLCTPLGMWKKQRSKVKAASADEVQQLLSELALHKCAPNALPPAAREASVTHANDQIHEVHRVV